MLLMNYYINSLQHRGGINLFYCSIKYYSIKNNFILIEFTLAPVNRKNFGLVLFRQNYTLLWVLIFSLHFKDVNKIAIKSSRVQIKHYFNRINKSYRRFRKILIFNRRLRTIYTQVSNYFLYFLHYGRFNNRDTPKSRTPDIIYGLASYRTNNGKSIKFVIYLILA